MYRNMIELYDLAHVESSEDKRKNQENRRATVGNFDVQKLMKAAAKSPINTEMRSAIKETKKIVEFKEETPLKQDSTEKENDEPSDSLAQKIYDETSRLSDRQRDIIQTTFKSIEKDCIRNGLKIFVRLFSEYPRYKLIWPQFRAIPDSSLMNAVELRRHASVYLQGLGKIIESMRNEEELGKQLSRISLAHIKWNVQRNHVIHMIDPLLEVVKECNGYKLDDETRVAWTVLYQVIANLIEVFRCRALHE